MPTAHHWRSLSLLNLNARHRRLVSVARLILVQFLDSHEQNHRLAGFCEECAVMELGQQGRGQRGIGKATWMWCSREGLPQRPLPCIETTTGPLTDSFPQTTFWRRTHSDLDGRAVYFPTGLNRLRWDGWPPNWIHAVRLEVTSDKQ